MTGGDQYEAVIGLEIHVQLATASKMFCRCDNRAEAATPNQHTCPVCFGMPGTLPVPNRRAVEWALKTALALGCQIPEVSKFDRKQYFYPDLPKGYQISQYDEPLGGPGTFEFDVVEDGKVAARKVRITRLHLEEDAGKLTHPKGAKHSLVDLNRAGTPLAEIVTEPDFRSPAEAKVFLQELRKLMRYLRVSEADMEKGHLRADANVSVRKKGDTKLGTKTELKNLNSFKFVERGLESEIERQIEVLESGGKVTQETRGFDEQSGGTKSQRSKEEAQDYRYFPEPDIPPLELAGLGIDKLRAELPELPVARRRRFISEYGLSFDDAETLSGTLADANAFEERVEAAMSGEAAIKEAAVAALAVAKIVLKEERAEQRKRGLASLAELPGETTRAVGLIVQQLAAGSLSRSAVSTVLQAVWQGISPQQALAGAQASQVDVGDVEKIVEAAIAANPKAVADYQAGNPNAKQAIVGAVMKETKGSADPTTVARLVEQKLD